MLTRWLASFAAGAALLLALPGAAEVAVPPLRARVTDLTGTLSPSQVQTLESRLRDFESTKGSQVAVLMLPTTRPETIEQYSIRVAEAWKIGRQRVDDGVILVVAKDDRAVRIEVGRGLEGAITDGLADRVIREVITPRFRSGDFYGGISAGTEALIALIQGESLEAPQPRLGTGRPIDVQTIFWLLVALVVGDAIFKRVFGRVAGAAVSGTIVAAIVWFAAGVLLFAVLGGLIAFFVTLVSGFGGGRGGWTSGGWGGGGWGGGGGWSGGGGFSGGGGDFGGGGASGRW
ncbi:MAG TPA: TPM domain-containing protein [Burkholderiales bacterium]|nr:TPM domain-containing protein [Burkholderiales bacterium]